MTVLRRILYLSTVSVLILGGTLLLKSSFVTGSHECSIYEFPCESGECLNSVLWCDSHEDCLDGSDEKYCRIATLFNSNPNKCPSTYFRCRNGPCIPTAGRCDGDHNCEDSSDEEDCEDVQATENTYTYYDSATPATVLPPKSEVEDSNTATPLSFPDASQSSVQVMPFSKLNFYDFREQRNRARNWILGQRRGDYGWGDETHRSITALCLSDEYPFLRNTESDLLMIKQMEIQLSLELARNGTKPMKLTDLALYINALQAICKDAKNFYGDDMVAILRDRVNSARKEGAFVNPSIYLTLCINNATTYEDAKHLHDIFSNWNVTVSKLHMQSLALLTAACIFRKTNYLNSSMYESIKMEFLHNLRGHGFPGNVYEAALLAQALQELKITLEGLTDFILEEQQADGSFGDILSTYLVLPILAGRTLLQMNDYCGQRNTPDMIPLEVLKSVKGKKMHVQYSLVFGFPADLTQTLQIPVARGASMLDVMRLAQEINPKYRFKLSENREVPVVYSIGGMQNDVEKGMYWTLYEASGNNNDIASEENWVPYDEDIKNLFPEDGYKALFWYKPIEAASYSYY